MLLWDPVPELLGLSLLIILLRDQVIVFLIIVPRLVLDLFPGDPSKPRPLDFFPADCYDFATRVKVYQLVCAPALEGS